MQRITSCEAEKRNPGGVPGGPRTRRTTISTDTENSPSPEVQVRFDRRERPLAIRYDGFLWTIDPDATVRHGGLDGWKVQARNSVTLEIRTVELFSDPHTGVWRLVHPNEE